MILSEDYHFLLPVCFLLAIQLCSDASQKKFSQIANANYRPVFGPICFFLSVSHSNISSHCGLSLYFGLFLTLPLPDVNPEDSLVCVPAVSGDTTDTLQQRHLISQKEGITQLMKSLRWDLDLNRGGQV